MSKKKSTPEREYVDLRLDQIVPSGEQPKARTKDIAGLVESVKAVGILQPIVVRETDNATFEIVAGHRRYAASLVLGLKTIPAIKVDADADRAQVLRVTENMHRENLTPLEEAAAIKKLRDIGRNCTEIAADLGTTPQFVARRAQLCELIPEWQKHIFAHQYNWPVAVMETIAQNEPDYQASLLQDILRYYNDFIPDVKWLNNRMAEDLHRLQSAPWRLDDDTLVPEAGACTACQKRSACQPELFFDELDDKKIKQGDKCLDPVCWEKKLAAALPRRITELRQKHGDVVMISTSYDPEDKKALSASEYNCCGKTDKNALAAILVDGPQAGRLQWIKKISIRSDSYGGGSSKSKPKAKKMADMKPAEQLKTKQARLDNRRACVVVNKLIELIMHDDHPQGLRCGESKGFPQDLILSLAITFGCPASDGAPTASRHYSPRNFLTFAERKDLDSDECIKMAWHKIRDEIRGHLSFLTSSGVNTHGRLKELHPLCDDILYISLDDLIAEAEHEIPEPKSLTALKEQLKSGKKQVKSGANDKKTKSAKKTAKNKSAK